jgi:phosphoadenosine phosphosulfate reductase
VPGQERDRERGWPRTGLGLKESTERVVKVSTVAGESELTQLREEMDEQSAAFETAPAGLIVAWAVDRFGHKLTMASSFQEAVLIDIAVQVDPEIEVVFLDTGSHFPETLEYVETIRQRYDLNLTVTQPVAGAEDWPCGTAQCCEFRKVRPMRQAMEGKEAWITGLKRVDAPTRREAPIVSFDDNWGMVKINPLATWTEQDIAGYGADHGIPRHPLLSQGYLSIGCAPTTRPVKFGEDPRAGRWSGSDKVECGLHV